MILIDQRSSAIVGKHAAVTVRGFHARTPGLEPQTGVSLGSQTVSPINMANAYATSPKTKKLTFLVELVIIIRGLMRPT